MVNTCYYLIVYYLHAECTFHLSILLIIIYRTDDELQKLKQNGTSQSKSPLHSSNGTSQSKPSSHSSNLHQTPDLLMKHPRDSHTQSLVEKRGPKSPKDGNFSSYKRLITAGSYSSKHHSKSKDEINR